MTFDVDKRRKLYWTVDGIPTYSKIEALTWAKGDISRIKFYFFDNEWKDKIWSAPPSKSLDQLIMERCHSLRDSTNHLCLWLSSGYDSVTILNRFIQYQLVIDEISIFKRRESDPEYPYALEIALNYKNNHNSNVKITEINLDYEYVETFYQRHKANALLLPGGINLRLTKSSLQILTNNNETALSILNNKSDRLDIVGFEKPRVTLYKDVWYAMFPDDVMYDHAGSRLKGFWLDEDCFELYHAQCWSVISWFETLNELTEILVHKIQSNDEKYYPHWNLSCGRDPVFNAYSTTAQGKHFFKNGINSPDSQEYLKHFYQYNNIIYNLYLENLHNFQTLVSGHWENIYSDFPVSKFTICSQSHVLRPRRIKSL